MNYLGHLYLSGKNEKILAGNFIGDFVKGKKYLDYPPGISEGILLHRQIDSFADHHSCFRESKKIFRPGFGLYSGIITDLLYDHLLAKNWDRYYSTPLHDYAHKVHYILLSHSSVLPSRVREFLPVLIKNRRLESYARQEGIRQSLERMSHYTSLPSHASRATELFEQHHHVLEENFSRFMADIMLFVKNTFGIETEITLPGLSGEMVHSTGIESDKNEQQDGERPEGRSSVAEKR